MTREGLDFKVGHFGTCDLFAAAGATHADRQSRQKRWGARNRYYMVGKQQHFMISVFFLPLAARASRGASYVLIQCAHAHVYHVGRDSTNKS